MRYTLIAANLAAPALFAVLWVAGAAAAGFALLFTVHMLTLYATLAPSCTWWGPQTRSFDAQGQRHVWLTIDDGPDPHDTPRILTLLAEHDAKATFFMIGAKAERWPELVRAVIAGGHEIGNHTMHHRKFAFWRLGPRAVRSEIHACQSLLTSVAGVVPRRFRAPAGMRNCFVHPVLSAADLDLIGWSVRGRDGVSTDRDAIVRRLYAGLQPGAILLMHEGMRDPQGNSVVHDTLPRILERLARDGYHAVVPQVAPGANAPENPAG